MRKWEYCEVIWDTAVDSRKFIIRRATRDSPETQTLPNAEWLNALAKLGHDGWEMTSVASSELQAEYRIYFKREVAT